MISCSPADFSPGFFLIVPFRASWVAPPLTIEIRPTVRGAARDLGATAILLGRGPARRSDTIGQQVGDGPVMVGESSGHSRRGCKPLVATDQAWGRRG